MIRTYEGGKLDGTFYRQVSPGLQHAMPTHPVAKLRRWGCANWDTLSPEVRAALLTDPDADVRTTAALSNDLHTRRHNSAMVEQDLPDHLCHARTGLLMYGALSRAVVDGALSKGDEALIAANPSLPPNVVALLSRDADPEVRTCIARRPDLKAEERRALATDPDPTVRLALSVHPALSEEERAAITYTVTQDGYFAHFPKPRTPRTPRKSAATRSPPTHCSGGGPHGSPRCLRTCCSASPPTRTSEYAYCSARTTPTPPAPLLLRSYLEYKERDRQHLLSRPDFPTEGVVL